MNDSTDIHFGTFEVTLERSKRLEADLVFYPENNRGVIGNGHTDRLHIDYLFGSLQNRVLLHRLGVQSYFVIADYQVLTDRDGFETISENVRQLTVDYLAAGINHNDGKSFIFPHSHVPELNQLSLLF